MQRAIGFVVALASAVSAYAATVDVRFEVEARTIQDASAIPEGASGAGAAFLGRRLEVGRVLRTVQREVPPGESPIAVAVQALIDGPTPEEAALGMFTHVPPGTRLVRLDIEGDTVIVDMSTEVLQKLDDHVLESIFEQFRITLGDLPGVMNVRLTCEDKLLADYLPPSPVIEPADENEVQRFAIPLAEPVPAATGLVGRKITIGPSHGRFHNGSGWFWQRGDPCGLGEAVLEDTNSIRLMQFLFQYLSQDGATVTVPRDLNENDCCHPDTGLHWWKMAARYWLQHQGLPSSVWDALDTHLNDDIRARPLFADYVGADIYIAHHTNAGANGSARGTETFRDSAMTYSQHRAPSLDLANKVQAGMINTIRELYDSCWVSRGVKDSAGGFGEIRVPNRPAILIELAFHDGCNPSSVGCGNKDTDALTNNYFRSVSQWGVYKGICDYFGVTPTWDKYSYEIVSDSIPSTMISGHTYNVSITLRNRGVVWSNAFNFRLGAVDDTDPFVNFNRLNISGEVRPGQTYTFNFQMQAPAPGNYVTDWRMVRDGVAWFGPILSRNVTVITDGGGSSEIPSQPTGLTAFAPSSTTVQLQWNASVDDVGVVGYEIRRNNTVINTSATNSYTDTTVVAGQSYTYEVRAFDAVPNYSGWSNSASLTTPAIPPADFIVESRSGGKNFGKYSEVGGFADTSAKSSAPGTTGGIGGRYGSANKAVAGFKQAFFRYDVPVTSTYEVFITSGNQSNRNSDVQVVITHAGGSTVTSFDEPANTNVWKSLGKYTFNAGSNTASVEMNNNNGNAAGSNVNVDSVKFVFIPPPPTPGPNRTICTGQTATIFASAATGETVDWYTGSCGGTLVQAGSTMINVSPASTTTYHARQRIVSNGIVSDTCSQVVVNVVPPPTVSAPTPSNPTVCAGGSVNFSVTAGGTGPLSYQWRRNGVNVGTDSPTLELTDVTPDDAGVYTCIVTGPGCLVVSPGTTLTVNGPCDDDDPCTADTCDANTGQCVFTPLDSDNDGTLDCQDGCPNDPNKTAPGVCGCDIAETDEDEDGVPDCVDNCPDVPNPDQADANNNLIGDACEHEVTITGWRSVRTHAGAGDLSLAIDAAATGNGLSGPTVETRTGGIQLIEVDFSGPITLDNPGGVTVTAYPTTGGIMGPATPYAPTSVTLADADTLAIAFDAGLLPDESCVVIAIGPTTLLEVITGDADAMVRSLIGDTTGNGEVNLGDAIFTNLRAGAPVATDPAFDVDLTGAIDLADALLVKSRVSSPARQAICP